MKLSTLPDRFDLSLERDGEFSTLGLTSYRTTGMLAFIENARYLPSLNREYVSCVLATPEIAAEIGPEFGLAVTKGPRRAFFTIHNYLAQAGEYPRLQDCGISPSARVDPRAYVATENVRIGARAVIEENVKIAATTWIGDDVVIRAGTIIGSDGFEFVRLGKEILPVQHAGGVWLCDRVEIQSNCCIDKAVFPGYTRIGEDTKIGHLSHVAHNIVIGQRCLIAPHVMMAGSCMLGDDVWLGPSVTISSEVKVGDGASITIGSVVTKNVAPGAKLSGNFAIDHQRFIDFMKTVR